MTVRQATYDEIPDILVVLEAARGIMRASGNARQWVDGYPGEQVIRADLAAGAGYVLVDTDGDVGDCVPGGTHVSGGNYVPGGNCVPGVAPEVSKNRPDLGQGIAPSRTQEPLSAPEVPPQNVDLGHLPTPPLSAAPDPAPAPTLAPNAAVAPIPGDAVGANQGANPSTAVGPDTPSNPSNGPDPSRTPMGVPSTHAASSATLPGSVSSRFGRFLCPLWAALRIFLPEVSKKRLDLGQGIGPSRTQEPLSAPEVPPQNVDLGHPPFHSPSAAPVPDPAPNPATDPTPAPTLAPNATVAPIPGDEVGANQGANPSTAVAPVPGATVRPDTPSNASNSPVPSRTPMGMPSTHAASSATLPSSLSSRFGRFLRPLWAALRIFLPEVSKKRPDLGQGIGPSRTQEPLSVPEVPPQNVDLGHPPTPPLSAAPDPAPAPTLATSLASSPTPSLALPAKAEHIVGYFAYMPSPEPTYARIYGGSWLDDSLPYHVIHRIASLPLVHGVFAAMLDFCSAAEPNLRIDTHSDNHIMQHLLARHGFTLCGTIYLASGSPRLAYQRLLPTATHPAK